MSRMWPDAPSGVELTIAGETLGQEQPEASGAYYHVRRMPPATGFAAPPIRILASAMWWVGLAGCYSPSPLPEGAPCQRTEQCPESQQCVLGSCSRSAQSPVDARPTPSDAMTDAMVDAMPVPCNADGLTCGGTPTVFLCRATPTG